jgi:hypothetical protein
MGYSFYRKPQFVEDYLDYFLYLKEDSEEAAIKHYLRFESALTDELLDDPKRHAYFKETDAPYRAKLFRVGKKTFWIIYTVDETVITLHRFWDTSRKAGTHGLTGRAST